MTEPEHKINGPVYASWDEAMADPNLDLSKPWYVAPDREWPDGWQTLEPIDETKPSLPPTIPEGVELGRGKLYHQPEEEK
jgi:hypothetical protein